MKIERISDSQIKFILSNSDLLERGIKIPEFVFGAEKAQALFREMLDAAMKEWGFNVDNSLLMIETVPVALDSIMITVTKVSQTPELESKLSELLPDVLDITKKFKSRVIFQQETYYDNNNLVYSFDTLDDIINLAERIAGSFNGSSSLYKKDNRYYLCIEKESPDDELVYVLNEYGQKHISTELSKYYFAEHGEQIIYNNAINTLAEYLV